MAAGVGTSTVIRPATLAVVIAGTAVALGAALGRAEEIDPPEFATAVAEVDTRAPTPTQVPRYAPSDRGDRRAAVRALAEETFPPEAVEWVVRTSACESGHDLWAYAAGFDRRWGVWYEFIGALQVDGVTWRRTARELFGGGDLVDPRVNFAMAAWVLEHGGRGNWPVCG